VTRITDRWSPPARDSELSPGGTQAVTARRRAAPPGRVTVQCHRTPRWTVSVTVTTVRAAAERHAGASGLRVGPGYAMMPSLSHESVTVTGTAPCAELERPSSSVSVPGPE
jgi:hypothetical protein